MKTRAVFYHAGCPVCVSAERGITKALDQERFDVEIVHLGENTERISEAENAGVKSVPALLIDKNVYHINYGASLSDIK